MHIKEVELKYFLRFINEQHNVIKLSGYMVATTGSNFFIMDRSTGKILSKPTPHTEIIVDDLEKLLDQQLDGGGIKFYKTVT